MPTAGMGHGRPSWCPRADQSCVCASGGWSLMDGWIRPLPAVCRLYQLSASVCLIMEHNGLSVPKYSSLKCLSASSAQLYCSCTTHGSTTHLHPTQCYHTQLCRTVAPHAALPHTSTTYSYTFRPSLQSELCGALCLVLCCGCGAVLCA